MNVSKYSVIVLLVVSFSLLWSDWDIRWCNANQWRLGISNYGTFGQAPNLMAGGFWPGNTDHNYINGAGLNIGAIKPNGDTIVTIGYVICSGIVEYAPGIAHSNPYDDQWHVLFGTDHDYPLSTVSLQDGYAVYNDLDPLYHMPDTSLVLGMTVTQKTYVWSIDWAADMIFVKYSVKNDTTYTLNDLFIGIPMDFDIGDETAPNDRCGIDLSRKMFYGWQEAWEPGIPPWRPGVVGLKLLSPCSLSSFKQFIPDLEPSADREWYLNMAGYNFISGVYEPYDTIWPTPGDQRVMMTAGPFSSLAPGDSIIVDWVLIASNDTLPPCTELCYKGDKAQTCYETGWHIASLTDPNGGEVAAGVYSVNYSATSVTGNALEVSLYLASPAGIDTIATGQSNTGSYLWNSALWPDGVLYKIAVVANDTITFGGDVSDGIFTIDNPGNTPPTLMVFTPSEPATLSGEYDITWFARDPEFGDSLYIDIYFKSQYDTVFNIIASDEPNDSLYSWNTVPYRNGSGILIIETHDEEFTVAETLDVYLLNQISACVMDHVHGLNNIVDLSALVHQSQQITGHTYELEFLEYRRVNSYWPEYIYEIVDSNTGVTVLDTYSLKDGYDYVGIGIAITDYSPIIDGFSIEALCNDYPPTIQQNNFHNDSVKVISGMYPEDSITLYGTSTYTWWAYRGARLQLDWTDHPSGGVTLLVTDLDYGDTISYKPYNRVGVNPDSAFGWCFMPLIPPNASPSDTLRPGYDNLIMLCGGMIKIALTVFPQVGDRWIVYPCEYAPPIRGNVYRFTPTGIAEHDGQIALISFQVYPVPFKTNLMIAYNLPKRQKVTLTIYDVLGRQVAKLKDGIENPGPYTTTWNGLDDRSRKVSAGVYFCRLETEDCGETKKLIMLK